MSIRNATNSIASLGQGNRMSAYVVSALFLLSFASVAAEQRAPRLVPEPYLGSWGASQQSCKDLDSDELAMRIENSRITIWGKVGEILVSPMRDPRDINMNVVFDGDGARITTLRFRISSSGTLIEGLHPKDNGVYRVKCQ